MIEMCRGQKIGYLTKKGKTPMFWKKFSGGSALAATMLFAITGCAPSGTRVASQQQSFNESLAEAIRETHDRRQAYVDAHPTLSQDFKSDIMHGKVAPGMSKGNVEAIEGGPPPADCPSSRSVTGEVWDYCVHEQRIGTLLTPEMHQVITFDQKGVVQSVSKSGGGPTRDLRLGGAPY